jgi:hypothetical protein
MTGMIECTTNALKLAVQNGGMGGCPNRPAGSHALRANPVHLGPLCGSIQAGVVTGKGALGSVT